MFCAPRAHRAPPSSPWTAPAERTRALQTTGRNGQTPQTACGPLLGIRPPRGPQSRLGALQVHCAGTEPVLAAAAQPPTSVEIAGVRTHDLSPTPLPAFTPLIRGARGGRLLAFIRDSPPL